MAFDAGFGVETVKMLSDMTEQQTKHINKLETDAMALKNEKAKLEVRKIQMEFNGVDIHHVDY